MLSFRFINNNIQIFWQVSLPKRLNSTRKHDLDKKWATFFYKTNIPLQCCATPNIHTSYESNL